MKINIKQICIYGMLAALTFAFKLVMAPLPNIEPTTLLLSLYTMLFGLSSIFIMAVYVLLEIIIYGCSMWSIGYLYIWLVLIIITHLIWQHRHNTILITIWNGIYGLLFGALYIPLYIAITGWHTAIAWWVAGISYDLIHGVSNLIISIILLPILYKNILKLKEKYNV